MRWLQYLFIALATLVIFCVTLVVTFLLLLDAPHYREALVLIVNRTTDHHLEIDGPLQIEFSLSPLITVSDIHFETAGKTFELESAEIRTRFELLPLLSKHLVIHEFLARDSVISYRKRPHEDEDTSLEYPQLNAPAIENFRIDNLVINYWRQDEVEPLQIKLDALKIDDKNDTGPVVLTGSGTISGNTFHLDGEFGEIATLLGSNQPYPVSFRFDFMDSTMQVEGMIANPHGDGELDIVVRQEASDLRRVLESVQVHSPDIGRLKSSYRLAGTLKNPQVLDLDIRVSKADVALQVSGNINRLRTAGNLNLDFSAAITDKALLEWLLPEGSPTFHSIQASGKLTGSAESLVLREATLDASGPDVQRLQVSGSAHIIDAPQPLRDLQATLSLSSSDTAFVKKYIKAVPQLGPVSGTARLTTDADALRAENIKLSVGNTSTVQLDATGSIRHIVFTPTVEVSKMELQLNLRGTSVKSIGKLIHRDLPDIGPVKLNAQYSGSLSRSTLGNMNLHAGSPDQLQLDVRGDIKLAALGGDRAISGLELDVNFQAPGTEYLSTITGTAIAALGRIQGVAHVNDTAGVTAISNLDIKIDKGRDFQLAMNGALADLENLDGLDMKLELSASDLNTIGEVFDLSLPKEGPVSYSGRVTGSLKKFHDKGRARLRNTTITTDLSASLAGKRPRLAGSVTVPDLDLHDIGIYLDRPAEEPVTPAIREFDQVVHHQAAVTKELFSKQPLDFSGLHAIDLDVEFMIRKLSSTAASVADIYAHVLLDNGKLAIKPLKYSVDDDVISNELVINSATKPPAVSLLASGDDINLGLLLADTARKNFPVRGTMTARANLKSRGQSPAELAATLDGEIEFVTENARIDKGTMNLVAVDVIGWAISNILSPNKDVEIECAILMMQFNKGMGTTDLNIIDTPDTLIRIDTRLDLANETMDVAILPEHKTRLFKAKKEPMEIYGPIANPQYKLVSVKDLALETGRAAFLAPLTISTSLLENITGLIVKPKEPKPGSCDKFLK
ncbi:MAG: AsmA family protein [Gammaproteobacteria bacterium]|nr:AsmA family protein [Gammaproteobacteria bacterium]